MMSLRFVPDDYLAAFASADDILVDEVANLSGQAQ
jgi:hypothetical protein